MKALFLVLASMASLWLLSRAAHSLNATAAWAGLGVLAFCAVFIWGIL